MKLSMSRSVVSSVALLSSSPLGRTDAFRASPHDAVALRRGRGAAPRAAPLFSATPSPEDWKRITEEEAADPTALAESAAAMKNMSSQDMAKLIAEVENMPDAQKAQLKDMGMDPDTMLVSMKMMKDNPQMMKTAQKLMSDLTPEQMLEQSRAAQEKMSSMTKEEMQQVADALTETSAGDAPGGAQPLPDGVAPGSSSDPNVLDAMYDVGELMSAPPDGKVTFQAFATLPPIAVLSGDRDQDLARRELAECWSDGSLGATRVDRAGFERVWKEVQEYFEEDIMEESRRTCHPKAKKVRSATSPEPEMPRVGANLSDAQLTDVNEAVKKMTDDDMMQMLDGMANIGPEEEARMKAMGADPALMRKAAGMMKSNPLMRKAAQSMMKNMNPEQMAKASQQAQEQMSRMSQDDLEAAMDQINKSAK